MNTGDLYKLAREHLARPDASTDPIEVAEAMADAIPAGELRPALRAALPLLVRRVVGERNARSAGVPLRRPAQSNGAASADLLDQVVCAGPGQWKQLRHCTRSELVGMASFRRQVSRQNTAMALQYERLARAMDEERLSIVGEVSSQVLTALTP